MTNGDFQKIKVLVETAERSFKGYIFKPRREDGFRLSDFLNTYGDKFLRLTDVEITDRGQHYRVGEQIPFVAISVAAITYLAPLEGE